MIPGTQAIPFRDMDKTLIRNIITLICLILVQVLICNHIMLFHLATPFVIIYLIVSLPMDLGTNALLTWAFISGFAVDIFSDTPGVNAMACTLLAMGKRNCLYSYVPRDDRTKNVVPSLSELGFSIYGKYLYSMSLIYCLLVFSIEYFSFSDVKDIVLMSVASSVFTFFVLLGIDSLIVSRREKRL